jgi:hypothetical protein
LHQLAGGEFSLIGSPDDIRKRIKEDCGDTVSEADVTSLIEQMQAKRQDLEARHRHYAGIILDRNLPKGADS